MSVHPTYLLFACTCRPWIEVFKSCPIFEKFQKLSEISCMSWRSFFDLCRFARTILFLGRAVRPNSVRILNKYPFAQGMRRSSTLIDRLPLFCLFTCRFFCHYLLLYFVFAWAKICFCCKQTLASATNRYWLPSRAEIGFCCKLRMAFVARKD